MSDIGPGDWVECVDVTPRRTPEHPATLAALAELRLGGLYQVRRVHSLGTLFLHGVLSGAERYGVADPKGFYADRFRPIYRPRDVPGAPIAHTEPVQAVDFDPTLIVRRASDALPPVIAYRDPSPEARRRIDWIKTAGLLLAFAANCAVWGGMANLLLHIGK